MASGGKHFDFTIKEHHLTLEEDRTLRFVSVDANDVNIISLAGWEVDCFIIERLDIADGPTALALVALLTLTEAAGIDIATPPNIDVTLADTDWATIGTEALLAYELWRTDAGNQRRLAHGNLEVAS